jgi:hypothetical protein
MMSELPVLEEISGDELLIIAKKNERTGKYVNYTMSIDELVSGASSAWNPWEVVAPGEAITELAGMQEPIAEEDLLVLIRTEKDGEITPPEEGGKWINRKVEAGLVLAG